MRKRKKKEKVEGKKINGKSPVHPIKTLTSPINPLLSQQHRNHLPQPSPLSTTLSKNPSTSSLNPLSLLATLSWQRNHLPSLSLGVQHYFSKEVSPSPTYLGQEQTTLSLLSVRPCNSLPPIWARLSHQKSLSHYLGKRELVLRYGLV